MIVDILGTEYTVTRNTSAIEGMGADGICQAYNRKIIYRDLKDFFGRYRLSISKEVKKR